jgi:hypothetical protein
MNWVVSTIVYTIGLSVVLNAIILAIYKLTSHNKK